MVFLRLRSASYPETDAVFNGEVDAVETTDTLPDARGNWKGCSGMDGVEFVLFRRVDGLCELDSPFPFRESIPDTSALRNLYQSSVDTTEELAATLTS